MQAREWPRAEAEMSLIPLICVGIGAAFRAGVVSFGFVFAIWNEGRWVRSLRLDHRAGHPLDHFNVGVVA
jgi:hypothetical protein